MLSYQGSNNPKKKKKKKTKKKLISLKEFRARPIENKLNYL